MSLRAVKVCILAALAPNINTRRETGVLGSGVPDCIEKTKNLAPDPQKKCPRNRGH
jgi:hypothetical protein